MTCKQIDQASHVIAVGMLFLAAQVVWLGGGAATHCIYPCEGRPLASSERVV